MRGSLLILNVVLIVELDSAVSQLGVVNLVATMAQSAGASPVPVHSADELETGDFLIGQVSDDLQHLATVAVETEHLEVHQAGSVNSVLEEQGRASQATKKVLCVLYVVPEVSLHFI